MKNLKNIFQFFVMIAFSLMVFSSCEKEELLEPKLQEQELTPEQGTNISSDTISHYAIFSFDVSDYENQELIDLYSNSTEEQQLEYRKNYLIMEFYKEQNIITDKNMESWRAKPISEFLDYQSNLNDSQITILEGKFETLSGAQVRSDCRWIKVLIWAHHLPNGSDVYDYRYVCYSNTAVLYTENNIRGSLAGVIDLHNNIFVNFTNTSGVDNDDARSVKLWNMKAGQILTFYDNSSGDTDDDYVVIEVLQDFGSYEINTFEASFSNSFLDVEYFENDNLDGKVSALNIEGNPGYICEGSNVVLYEGNDITEDVVGEIDVCSNFLMNFTDNPDVENDEARSAELFNMKAGQILTFYDNSSGYTNDDYVVIEILQDFTYSQINTFEASFSNALMTVEYFEDDNLDGKVSALRVEGNL